MRAESKKLSRARNISFHRTLGEGHPLVMLCVLGQRLYRVGLGCELVEALDLESRERVCDVVIDPGNMYCSKIKIMLPRCKVLDPLLNP